MNIFKKIFGGSDKSNNKLSDKNLNIENLLKSDDLNNSIIEIDNFVCELCSWGDELEKLTEQQKNFYFNQNLEREINNGGFYQFFFNTSGDFAFETINSLKIIGANKTAVILQKAIDQFPDKSIPKDRAERQEVLVKIEALVEKTWEELGRKFYVYEDDLNTLNIEYIRQNIEKFNS